MINVSKLKFGHFCLIIELISVVETKVSQRNIDRVKLHCLHNRGFIHNTHNHAVGRA